MSTGNFGTISTAATASSTASRTDAASSASRRTVRCVRVLDDDHQLLAPGGPDTDSRDATHTQSSLDKSLDGHRRDRIRRQHRSRGLPDPRPRVDRRRRRGRRRPNGASRRSDPVGRHARWPTGRGNRPTPREHGPGSRPSYPVVEFARKLIGVETERCDAHLGPSDRTTDAHTAARIVEFGLLDR